jgi:Protein of unknown function (DUF1214)
MGRRSVAGMLKLERSIVSMLARRFRSRAVVELENLALRHQLHVLRRRRPGRVRLFAIDRLVWVQTRSMLDTPQLYPRAGSQDYPSPTAQSDADGSTTVYFGPSQPAGIKRGNWIQTLPGKGWFTILRLYSPLEPFFTKAWRPSEIEVVK